MALAPRLAYSVDGGDFRPLFELKSRGAKGWSPMFEKRLVRAKLPKGAGRLALRFELSGEGAQLWSHARPVDRMLLTARLDARTFAPPFAPEGPVDLGLAEPRANDVGVLFARRPWRFFDQPSR